jgi:hypothetical protein
LDEFTQDELKRLFYWFHIVECEGQKRTVDDTILKKLEVRIIDKSFFDDELPNDGSFYDLT